LVLVFLIHFIASVAPFIGLRSLIIPLHVPSKRRNSSFLYPITSRILSLILPSGTLQIFPANRYHLVIAEFYHMSHATFSFLCHFFVSSSPRPTGTIMIYKTNYYSLDDHISIQTTRRSSF